MMLHVDAYYQFQIKMLKLRLYSYYNNHIQSHTRHSGNISTLPKSDHEKRSSCTYPDRGRVARHVNEAEEATLSAANSPQLRPELLCPHKRQRLMYCMYLIAWCKCAMQVREL